VQAVDLRGKWEVVSVNRCTSCVKMDPLLATTISNVFEAHKQMT
jgi:hypothetical protein